MTSVKKRTINFTPEERRILTELVSKYHNIVENKQTGCVSHKEKLEAWMKMAEEFNNLSDYCHRTHAEIKRCWENNKSLSKKKRVEAEKRIFKNEAEAEMPSTPLLNDNGCAVVEAVLGTQAGEGSSNIYDSGNEEDWLHRHWISKQDNSDASNQEKVALEQMLKQNALRESQLRIAILEEKLKQEKLKTQILMGNDRDMKREIIELDNTGDGSQDLIWSPDSTDPLTKQEN